MFEMMHVKHYATYRERCAVLCICASTRSISRGRGRAPRQQSGEAWLPPLSLLKREIPDILQDEASNRGVQKVKRRAWVLIWGQEPSVATVLNTVGKNRNYSAVPSIKMLGFVLLYLGVCRGFTKISLAHHFSW